VHLNMNIIEIGAYDYWYLDVDSRFHINRYIRLIGAVVFWKWQFLNGMSMYGKRSFAEHRERLISLAYIYARMFVVPELQIQWKFEALSFFEVPTEHIKFNQQPVIYHFFLSEKIKGKFGPETKKNEMVFRVGK
jgi:hypothetical protein